MRKKLSILLILLLLFTSINIIPARAGTSNKVPLQLYYTFYDDIGMFCGLYGVELTGTIEDDGMIYAIFNEAPNEFDLGEPFVFLNNGAPNSMTKDITDECEYSKETGIMKIPAKYKDEDITMRTELSTNTKMYEYYIPGCFRGTDVNDTEYPAFGKYLNKGKIRLQDFIGRYSEFAFTVIENSCNDVYVDMDISWIKDYVSETKVYSTGNGMISNVGITSGDLSSNFLNTGTDEYAGFAGENTGFAVSFYYFTDENLNKLFSWTGIGHPGKGKSTFPTCVSFANATSSEDFEYNNFEGRNWMYARCVEATNNNFAGGSDISKCKC